MSAMRQVALHQVARIDRDILDPAVIKNGSLYVGLENIESGGRLVDVRRVAAGELLSSKFAFSSRHLLYGKLRPYLAKIARPDFDGICSTDILPILPGPDLDRGYLAWLLLSPEMVKLASSRATGANLPRLSPNALAELKIPLPPMPEQRRIAAILDKVDALQAERRAVLNKFDDLTHSIFLDMFGDPATNPKGWPTRALGSLAEKFSDGPFGSNLKTEHYVESGVRVVRLQNIGSGKFINDDTAYVSESHFLKLRKHECLPGDILVGTLGEPNLRACIQPSWLQVALNKADCVQIRPNPAVATAEFVCGLLNQPSTELMARELMHGQTRVRISMGNLRQLEVPVPPISLQRKFVRLIAAVEKLSKTHQTNAAYLKDLFASLQSEAFRGELVPRPKASTLAAE